jgi:diguanylate cyclase (GGDEF)-like protein
MTGPARANGMDRESARLAELDRYDILDTPPEEPFDRLTRLAQKVLGVPIAAVSFIDAHRQWCKAGPGLAGTEVPRHMTFCRLVVADCQPLIVRDATKDPRFAANPFVVGDPGVRSYAGVPLRSKTGYSIGSFCVVDLKPREFRATDLEVLSDLAEMAMAELELRYQSVSDGLTGVLSRRAFHERANRAIALARRHRRPIACIIADLDHFKAINDAHGHAGGDVVLAETARACGALLRDTDIMGRIGGEEFAIVLPETGIQGGMDTAERLRAKIDRLRLTIGDIAVHVTASFGVAALKATAADIDALLRLADRALYQAKASGRNQCFAAEAPPRLSAPRQRVLKGGEMLFKDSMASIICTVRSLSEDGAGLDVSSTIGIPKHFTLMIRADAFSRPCRVESRSERHLDVAFEPCAPAST